jgi:alkylhydroperoxidase family enzyme
MTMHGERISVPTATDLRDDASALLPLPRTMAVLGRQPDLLAPFLGWAAALALSGVLSHRDHELLALRVAANCGSEFEWVEHTKYARSAGLSEDEIRRVREPAEDGTWAEEERALLRTTDELTSGFDVSDATWAELARHFEQPALVEILFVVGQYSMLSMFANAAGITP